MKRTQNQIKKWCPLEEREVPWSEIKIGYEITKNNYVVLEKEEVEISNLRQPTQLRLKNS